MKLFFFSALFLSLAAQADFSPEAAGDWNFVTETHPTFQQPSCRSSTSKSNSADFLQLSVQFAKSGNFVPHLTIATRGDFPAVAVKLSDTEMEFFYPWRTEPTGTTYWYAPKQFSKVLEFLRQKSVVTLILDPKGSAVPVTVSLKGSAATIDQAKNCANATDFSPFFVALHQEKQNLQPDLGDRSLNLLVQAVENAYLAFAQGGSTQKSLASLRKNAAPLLKKEEAAMTNTTKSAANLQTAESALQTAVQNAGALEQAILASETELQQLQQNLAAAEMDLAQKAQTYLQLKEQLAPYDQLVRDSEQEVASLQRSVQEKEQIIANNARVIARLQAELSQIQSDIPGLQNEVNRLEIALQTAESDLRRYDLFREKQNILDRDWQYRNLKMDFDNKQRELQRLEWDLRRAERDYDRASDNLRRCQQMNPGNCFSEQNELNRADRERDQARREMQRLERDLQWLRTQMDWRESAADREARAEYDRLRSRRDAVAQQTLQARNELSNKRNRSAEIQIQLPRLEQERGDAERILPELRAQLQSAESRKLTNLERRNAFANQIGYPQVEATYLEAKRIRDSYQAQVKEKNAKITKMKKDFAEAQKAVVARTQERDKALAAHRTNENNLAQIREQLRPIREQEAALLAQLQVEEEKFLWQQALYQDLATYWRNR
jgi:chromosome segregation ATPase